MKTTQLYDFTLTANGSQQIQADANFYKILTSTGDVSITRDGGSTVKPLRAGRGERNVDFLTLTIKDLSGAPNSGTILVGDSDFIDDTIVLSSAISVRPEPVTGSFKSNGALAANTAEVIFTPGSNTQGAIIYAAEFSDTQAVMFHQAILSKSGLAPSTVVDGNIVTAGRINNSALSNPTTVSGQLVVQQFVPAGEGLYFISSTAVNVCLRSCRYKLL